MNENDSWCRYDCEYVCFTATSEKLGAYKNSFYVTADGYVETNIFDIVYCYYIGEASARKIIDYANGNSSEVEVEPYEYRLVGRVTEITEQYIAIDDSFKCVDEKNGMIFKIPTDDIRIGRHVQTNQVEVGDYLAVSFLGEISIGADNVVLGAYDLSIGYLQADGGVAIPE